MRWLLLLAALRSAPDVARVGSVVIHRKEEEKMVRVNPSQSTMITAGDLAAKHECILT